MKEDIEILEKLISWKGKRVEIVVKDGEITAIENLINRVKELEEIIKAKDKYISGLHQDLQEAIYEIDKLRGEENE